MQLDKDDLRRLVNGTKEEFESHIKFLSSDIPASWQDEYAQENYLESLERLVKEYKRYMEVATEHSKLKAEL